MRCQAKYTTLLNIMYWSRLGRAAVHTQALSRSASQAKYKWEPAGEPGAVARIEGLEITSTFDPTQTGFADLSGATPVLVTKARLRFERE